MIRTAKKGLELNGYRFLGAQFVRGTGFRCLCFGFQVKGLPVVRQSPLHFQHLLCRNAMLATLLGGSIPRVATLLVFRV